MHDPQSKSDYLVYHQLPAYYFQPAEAMELHPNLDKHRHPKGFKPMPKPRHILAHHMNKSSSAQTLSELSDFGDSEPLVIMEKITKKRDEKNTFVRSIQVCPLKQVNSKLFKTEA